MLIGQFAIMPQDKHCVYHFKECLDLLKLYIFKNRHEMLLGTICQRVATKTLRVPSQGMFKFIHIVPTSKIFNKCELGQFANVSQHKHCMCHL